MAIRIFVLPTQYDIIDFRLGNRPENIMVRDFDTQAEFRAYENGIEAVSDEYERIEGLHVAGTKVSYVRRTDDPEADAGMAKTVELQFRTPAEAEAYRKGVEDSEGFAAPLLVDDTDDRFDQLLAWGFVTAPAS